MNPMTTTFIARLRDRDDAAWFELWTVFGPVIRRQLSHWGKGNVGAATVEDLTQDTLTALSKSIGRFDPTRGARFSTWLLAIAKHVLGDELDRRYALKRGRGRRPAPLDEAYMGVSAEAAPDQAYERAIFQAKVHAAIRSAQRDSEFLHFEVYRMRVFEGRSGKTVAVQLGLSEPTVSRHLRRVRDCIRSHVRDVVALYSFTDDEAAEVDTAGLAAGDDLFDEAICEIHVEHSRMVEDDERRLSEI